MPRGISLGHSLVFQLLGANPRLCRLHLMRDDDEWRLLRVTLRRLVAREWETCGCIKDGENIGTSPLYHFFSYSLSIVAEKKSFEFFLLPFRRKNLGLTPLSMFFLRLWNMSIHRNLDSFLVEARPIPLRLRRLDTGDASGSNATDIHPS